MIGLPDPYRGEHPRAYVTLNDGADVDGERPFAIGSIRRSGGMNGSMKWWCG